MNLGTTEVIVLWVIGTLIFFIPALIGGIDAATKSDLQWQRAGQNKMLWVLGQILGALFCGVVGLVFFIIYMASIRPQVVAAGPAPGSVA